MPRPRLAIGAPPLGLDRELRAHLDQQRQAILELAGASGSGDPMQRAVRIQDLVDSNVVLRPVILSGGFAQIQPNPSPVNITPPQVTNLSAVGSFTAVLLDWDWPNYEGHSHAEVLRSTSNVYATAEVVGIALGGLYQDYVPTGVTYYYWVRFVSTSNIKGAPSSVASAARATDPTLILASLVGAITETHLYTTLNSRINLIDGPDSLVNSVSWKVLQEANARISADGSLNTLIVNETSSRIAQDLIHTDNFALLGARRGDNLAFQLSATTVEVRNDANTGWVSIGNKFDALVSRVTTAEGDITVAEAAIVTEASTRATADGLMQGDISAHTTNFTLMGARALGDSVWDLNMTTVRVDANGGGKTGIGQRLTQIQGEIDDNTAAVATKAAISTVTGIDNRLISIEAEYTVKVDVNGYVAGYGISSVGGPTGTPTSAFAVLADKFIIGFPSNKWQASTAYSLGQYVSKTTGTDNNLVYEATTAGTSGGSEPVWPTIVGNTVNDGSVVWTCRTQASTIPFVVGLVNGTKTVGINGDLVVDGTILARHIVGSTITGDKIAGSTITANKLSVTDLSAVSANLGSITSGNITIDSSGYIKGGATGYLSSTPGFWLGYTGGAYKFSIGDSDTQYLAWDGSNLILQGNLVDLGAMDYAAGTTQIAAANTERNSVGSDENTWVSVKRIRLRRKGVVTVAFDYRRATGTVDAGWGTQPSYRLKQGTTVLSGTTTSFTNSTYSAASHDVTVTSPNDGDLYLEIKTGYGSWYAPFPDIESGTFAAYVRNMVVKVSNPYGEGAVVD